jgi:hypothetical protein
MDEDRIARADHSTFAIEKNRTSSFPALLIARLSAATSAKVEAT